MTEAALASLADRDLFLLEVEEFQPEIEEDEGGGLRFERSCVRGVRIGAIAGALVAIDDTDDMEADDRLKRVVTSAGSYLCRKVIVACGLLHYPRRLVVLGSHRPVDLVPDSLLGPMLGALHRTAVDVTRVQLSPLDTGGVAQLMALTTGVAPSAEVAAWRSLSPRRLRRRWPMSRSASLNAAGSRSSSSSVR